MEHGAGILVLFCTTLIAFSSVTAAGWQSQTYAAGGYCCVESHTHIHVAAAEGNPIKVLVIDWMEDDIISTAEAFLGQQLLNNEEIEHQFWTDIGADPNITVVFGSPSQLGTLLQTEQPDVIVLDDICLDMFDRWGLNKDERLAIFNYIEEGHGLILTHATLSDFRIKTDGVSINVNPYGHINRLHITGGDVTNEYRSSLAAMTGLGLLPLYEELREYIGDAMLGTPAAPLVPVIYSVPLMVSGVPFGGTFTTGDATDPILQGVGTNFNVNVRCPICRHMIQPISCVGCGGNGQLGSVSCSACGGTGQTAGIDCPFCEAGQAPGTNCLTCNGTGTCQTCGGDGMANCSICNGSGQTAGTTCVICNGTGVCQTCDGDGKVDCSTCNGTGQTAGTSCAICGGAGTCQTCGGDGKVNCSICGADGQISCPTCGGDGKIDCSLCGGDGQISCELCGGDGKTTCVVCGGSGCLLCGNRGWFGCLSCGGDLGGTAGRGWIGCLTCGGDGGVTAGRGWIGCLTCGGDGGVTAGRGWIGCSLCGGSGATAGRGWTGCSLCGGLGGTAGSGSCVTCGGDGYLIDPGTCAICSGRGWNGCSLCGGLLGTAGSGSCVTCGGDGYSINPGTCLICSGRGWSACSACGSVLHPETAGDGECVVCGGDGYLIDPGTCWACGGDGYSIDPGTCLVCGGDGIFIEGGTCPLCGGDGNFSSQDCLYCGGDGYVPYTTIGWQLEYPFLMSSRAVQSMREFKDEVKTYFELSIYPQMDTLCGVVPSATALGTLSVDIDEAIDRTCDLLSDLALSYHNMRMETPTQITIPINITIDTYKIENEITITMPTEIQEIFRPATIVAESDDGLAAILRYEAGNHRAVYFSFKPSAGGSTCKALMKNAITWTSSPTGAAQPTPTIQDVLQELARVEGEQVSSISTQTPTLLTFEKAEITGVTLTLTTTINDVAVVVDNLEEKPAYIPTKPAEVVYRYYDISTNLEDPTKLSSANIEFKVEKLWINANNIDSATVKLLKYQDGQWVQLTTQKVNEDDTYVYYSAQVTGFSVFAITGEKAAAPTEAPAPGLPLIAIVGVVIVITVVILVAALKIRRKSGG